MFQVNDVIIYGTQGVCTITGTDVKSVGGVKKTYYILQPVRENGCTVYAPVDNPHPLRHLRLQPGGFLLQGQILPHGDDLLPLACP